MMGSEQKRSDEDQPLPGKEKIPNISGLCLAEFVYWLPVVYLPEVVGLLTPKKVLKLVEFLDIFATSPNT
jgi:hypothetical protein